MVKSRRIAALLSVAGVATGAAVVAAPAQAAAPKPTPHARPSAPYRALTTVCNINLGGGKIRVTLTPVRDNGAFATYSVQEEQLVPRKIHWKQNAVVDNNGNAQRGPGGWEAYGDTQWFTASDVDYGVGAWYTGQATDTRDNFGWNSCPLRKTFDS